MSDISPSCVKFLKTSVFSVNMILWIIGAVGVCVAGFHYYLLTSDSSDDEARPWSGSYGDARKMLQQARGVMLVLTLITGSIMVLVGFLGCCGASLNSRCFLVMYAGLICVVLAVEVVIISAIVWQKDQGPRIVEEVVLTKIKLSNDYNHEDWKSIHAVQRIMKCCGVYSYHDYIEANHSVPLSCCNSSLTTPKHYQQCNFNASDTHILQNEVMIYQRGCGEVIRSDVAIYTILGYSVMGVLIFLQLVSFVFSCVLIRSLTEWPSPRAPGHLSRASAYMPAEVREYRVGVPPAYENGSQHSSFEMKTTLAH